MKGVMAGYVGEDVLRVRCRYILKFSAAMSVCMCVCVRARACVCVCVLSYIILCSPLPSLRIFPAKASSVVCLLLLAHLCVVCVHAFVFLFSCMKCGVVFRPVYSTSSACSSFICLLLVIQNSCSAAL